MVARQGLDGKPAAYDQQLRSGRAYPTSYKHFTSYSYKNLPSKATYGVVVLFLYLCRHIIDKAVKKNRFYFILIARASFMQSRCSGVGTWRVYHFHAPMNKLHTTNSKNASTYLCTCIVREYL